jgi:hypothetical protein
MVLRARSLKRASFEKRWQFLCGIIFLIILVNVGFFLSKANDASDEDVYTHTKVEDLIRGKG